MDAALLESLLPRECPVRIRSVDIDADGVRVAVESTADAAHCPDCRCESRHVHGRYTRQLQDRPCLGHRLRLTLSARKFVCRRDECPRGVFCERWTGLAEPHARTTTELADAHRSIGFALGGEAGARLAETIALPTSPDTILRRVKSSPDEPTPPPRYVGVDDWACRKGQVYGTILVDLERGTVIDLLPGRDGEGLKTWLAKNPQVEVITRDRWPAYREAAAAAAPQARQVADRFHLLRNVREAVEKLLSRHGGEIRRANTEVGAAGHDSPANEPTSTASAPPVPTAPSATPAKPVTEKEQRRADKRRTREERFRQVKDLTAQGYSGREIARRLGIDIKAVLRYRRADHCPDWQPGRALPTGLDPYAAFITEWIEAGNRNSADLYRDLKKHGYCGSYDAVRRYLNRRIGSSGRPGRRAPTAQPPRRSAPSARRLSFRLTNPKPGSHSTRVLGRVREKNPTVNAALDLAEELLKMFRRRGSMTLKEWTTKAGASGDADLKNLAVSLLQDAAAVEAAMTEDWSNGPVEGQVNRLKKIKRQMYGRAGMKLFRAQVRHKGS